MRDVLQILSNEGRHPVVRALVLLALAGLASYAATRIVARPDGPFRRRAIRTAASVREDGPAAIQDAAYGIEIADRAAEEETFPQRTQALDELRSEMKRESV